MKRLLIASMAMLAPLTANADGFMHWQNNSVSYLYGTGYEVDSNTQQTITLEHASGWSVGDLFMFVDAAKYHGGADGDGYYGEISPRFSAGKISGKDFSFGIVKDVLVATTFEFGEDATDTLLVGAGVDLDLPGFDFFQLNVYQRFPESGDGKTIQITPVWQMTFPMGDSAIVFDGFIDYNVNSDGGYKKNIHINPQIKYDLGKVLGLKERSLMAGVELDVWINKYGIGEGVEPFLNTKEADQTAGSLIVKYHF